MRTLLLAFGLLAAATQAAEPLAIDVYRDPACGCCKAWMGHLETQGFKVMDHPESDMPALKTRLGVPPRLGSCHTAVIDGKFVEGHVPAAEILALRRQPDLLGIAVPGMPAGAPGMDAGDYKVPYQVLGVGRDGSERVLADYP
ncbi:DUF411 domain-containing protein [Pseudomonas sp. RIT-PI-AD]|uniref:DUF411 domain-containing protein n=1 Tax=Pseudomonas sp. RIT-PI-AD TaxID=3035294 RepID=UPI0021D8F59D|nr:DUF411 domain-containing protein [Pseudomonas sp. RIT-PI-AD]